MAIPTLHPIITLKTVKLIKTHTNYSYTQTISNIRINLQCYIALPPPKKTFLLEPWACHRPISIFWALVLIKVWAKPRLFFGQPAGCTPKGIFYALPNQAYQAVLYSLFSSQ